MWYNFKTHDKMTDAVFEGMLNAEIAEGKDPMQLLAIARLNGWEHQTTRGVGLHIKDAQNDMYAGRK
jgi:hypothetical protein